MSFAKRWLSCSLILCTVLALGCGADEFGRSMASISGKVTVKGAPVQISGQYNRLILIFEKTGEQNEKIPVNADGTYSGKAPVGPNKVALQVYGDVPGVDPKFQQDVTVESGKVIDLEVGAP